MTPPNERKAKERKAKRDAGLVRVEVWVRPEHKQAVRAYAKSLNQTDMESEFRKAVSS